MTERTTPTLARLFDDGSPAVRFCYHDHDAQMSFTGTSNTEQEPQPVILIRRRRRRIWRLSSPDARFPSASLRAGFVASLLRMTDMRSSVLGSGAGEEMACAPEG